MNPGAHSRTTATAGTCNTDQKSASARDRSRVESKKTSKSKKMHDELLAFSECALESDLLDEMGPDLNAILSIAGVEDDIYELMATVPDDEIGGVLAWFMNVDVRARR